VFRDDLEQVSGMKVNTGSGMKPNSSTADPLTIRSVPGEAERRSGIGLKLAGEPGALMTDQKCEAAHRERLRGRDRLSHRPRTR
jgi:hypothetical protein